ncbi:hypothetical protein AAVH_37613 [Aphelenchoides avenae]|nr:hypothetical protein AAVH_37613 [Aphelenchus avenae]
MCCNCDGGCRSHRSCPSTLPEPRGRRAGNLQGSSAALDRFKAVDVNGDNVIDKQEMRSYFAAANVTVSDGDFFDADRNRNGFMDPHEFDLELQ